MLISRRSAIAAGGSAAIPLPTVAEESAGGTPPPLVIGVLTDTSGLGASVSGPPLERAVRLALADVGTMPDKRTVSLVTEVFQLRPDQAVAIARGWFDQGVSAIIDVPGSAAAGAVQALARARGRSFLVTGSVNSDLTGSGCAPVASYWATDTASMTRALVRSLARTGVKDWYLVVPDTVLGLGLQDDAMRAIEEVGGQLVGRSRHPPDTAEYAFIAERIKESGAHAVGLCDITQSLQSQLRAFRTAGLFDGDRRVVAFLPSIVDVHTAGAEVARDLLLAAPFYWTQNDQSRSFATRFFADTGRMPDPAHAAAYVAVRHFLRAVASSGSIDADVVNKEMQKIPVYYFGRSARLRLDGRLVIELSLLRVKPPADMQSEWDHYEAVGPIPLSDTYPTLGASGCRLNL